MNKRKFITLALASALAGGSATAQAFCGFYVGKADASLFNEASKVVMVRDGERTVINMLNDYQGALSEFALVVPVPVVLQKEDVKTPQRAVFDRIDAYSAPRLAEYYDPNPCHPQHPRSMAAPSAAQKSLGRAIAEDRAEALGVRVEAQYTVGPYDIVILSAEQSDGLETWLHENGYRIPAGASQALAPYIRQDMKFFVAKVNLEAHAKSGAQMLAPLQFAFRTDKFMLPIRLGMINARGPQDLVLWVLSSKGRVETTNYRTVKLPANVALPPYVKFDRDHSFARFYKSMFDEQAKRENYRVVFTEYFWDMSWCDPCAANPLTAQELANLGVEGLRGDTRRGARVMLTRLHLRYTPETFPEDLVFQETADRRNWQTRYVLRHPAKFDLADCPAQASAMRYLEQLRRRQEQEAQTLATLTGWDVDTIRVKAVTSPPAAPQPIAPGADQGLPEFPLARLWRWLQGDGATP
jgi:hypothetical protein